MHGKGLSLSSLSWALIRPFLLQHLQGSILLLEIGSVLLSCIWSNKSHGSALDPWIDELHSLKDQGKAHCNQEEAFHWAQCHSVYRDSFCLLFPPYSQCNIDLVHQPRKVTRSTARLLVWVNAGTRKNLHWFPIAVCICLCWYLNEPVSC